MSYAGKVSANEELHLIGSTLYGTCSTAASTAAKVAALSDFDTLLTGVTVFIKFNYANTAANATLNVNNTGALPIYVSGINSVGTNAITSWEPNSIVAFTYDGSAWLMNGTNKVVLDTVDCLVSDGRNHNGIYRGKNLGTITSANIGLFVNEHEIPTGKFTDLYLGDYFVIQDGTYNKEWMIAGFDLDYGKQKSATGSTYPVSDHAITVIPRGAGLFKARMNASASTDTGYLFSELEVNYLRGPSNLWPGEPDGATYTILYNTLGSHMKDKIYVLSGQASGGVMTGSVSGAGWAPLLMNEVEVFGTDIMSVGDKAALVSCKMLPVFQFIHPAQFDTGDFWLSGIYSATEFVCTRFCGAAAHHATATSTDYWVRPKLAIG